MTEYNPVKYEHNKGGRPRLPLHELRTHKIEFWLSDIELADLHYLAEQAAVSNAALVRSLISKKPLKRITTPAVNRETYALLGGIANNVNQLAKVANRQGLTEKEAELGQLNHVINKLRAELLGVQEQDDS